MLHEYFYLVSIMSSEYKRGFEDCIDIIYYKYVKLGIRDNRVYRVLRELQAAVTEDKINKLMDRIAANIMFLCIH
jgi:hypothetical protein